MATFSVNEKLSLWIREIRRDIHTFPELSFQEIKTSNYIFQKLAELGISFKRNIGKTGIVATLGNNDPNLPCIALRADMDALPIEEKTGLSFSSQNPGVMHACGHDGHVAMLLGAAALLQDYDVPGRVKLIFQPAEEAGGGAKMMVEKGVLNGVNAIISGHIDRHFCVGEIAVQPGLICAFTDEFKIEITGRGGHAAKPHETTDTIMAGCSLVTSIQSIVSREINPLHPSVISIGKIRGGDAPNAIAEKTIIEGTIRSTDKTVREQLKNGITRMVNAMQDLSKSEMKITFIEGYLPVINDKKISEIARSAASKIVGSNGVLGLPYPSMGGEDFSFYLKEIPGCFVRLGAKKDGLALVSLLKRLMIISRVNCNSFLSNGHTLIR